MQVQNKTELTKQTNKQTNKQTKAESNTKIIVFVLFGTSNLFWMGDTYNSKNRKKFPSLNQLSSKNKQTKTKLFLVLDV